MKIYGGFLPVGKRIGFGGTQYTLWNIGPEIEGVQEALYYQNIGSDLAEVKAKYPDLPITDLKGEVWILREPQDKHERDTDYFKFGRYSHQKFADVDDTEYKKWYASEDNFNETLAIHMTDIGFTKTEDGWMTEQEVEAEIEEDRLRKIRDNRTVEGAFSSNFNAENKDILFATEEEPQAIRYYISEALVQQLKYASYREWNWAYLPELAKRRSMKNQLFTVTFKDRVIVKIEKVLTDAEVAKKQKKEEAEKRASSLAASMERQASIDKQISRVREVANRKVRAGEVTRDQANAHIDYAIKYIKS